MTAISGTTAYRTVVTVVAASSGNGDTIAAKFNGIVIPGVSSTAAVATNASGTVTIYWPQTGSSPREADRMVLDTVMNIIAADTSLTSPIDISVATQGALTS